MKIDHGFTYLFDITDDPSSQGNDRFEVIIKKDVIYFINEDAFNQNIKINPNPAKDFIQVRFSKQFNSSVTIRLINSLGQIKKSIQNHASNNSLIIPVNDLASGIYFLEIDDGMNKFIQKIIKE